MPQEFKDCLGGHLRLAVPWSMIRVAHLFEGLAEIAHKVAKLLCGLLAARDRLADLQIGLFDCIDETLAIGSEQVLKTVSTAVADSVAALELHLFEDFEDFDCGGLLLH